MIDGIIPEPEDGAQTDHDEAAALLKAALVAALEELEDVPADELRRMRRAKFRDHGRLRLKRGLPRLLHTVHRVFNAAKPGSRRAESRTPTPVSSRTLNVFHRRGCGLLLARDVAKLDEYRRKRDPKRTPEPFGGSKRAASKPIFVIQRHDARQPALRLPPRAERRAGVVGGAEGRADEPGERVLAVHVEDHPLDYASFEGEIPQGEYGAGTVELWDRGTYELVEEKPDGGLTVRLARRAARGRLDARARAHGRQGAELAADPQARRRGRAATESFSPMLATPADELPRGGGWLFEVKWDGYRAIAYVRGGECRLVSRNGNDLTARFAPSRARSSKALKTPNAVLDGEVCALDERRPAELLALQGGAERLVYYAFDVLEADGEWLVALPLVERQERLRALLDRRSATVGSRRRSTTAKRCSRRRKAQGLEGVMAKRADSPYRPGRRSRDWLKVKTHGRQEFVVAGYTRGEGRRARASARSCSRVTRAAPCAGSATRARASATRRSTGCWSCCARSSGPTSPFPSRRRCRASARATSCGWSRGSSPRSSSASGRATAACVIRATSACATTRRRPR